MTFAFHQSDFGVDYAKPTRLLTDLGSLAAGRALGWPRLDPSGKYLGPLGRAPEGLRSLVTSDGKRKRSLAEAATYPPAMNMWIARAILADAMVATDPFRDGALVGGDPPPSRATTPADGRLGDDDV